MSGADAERAVEIAEGSVLRDRFVLEEQLEHGRLGSVFRALDRHRSGDGREAYVEILVLPAYIAGNAAQLETFKREFSAVQALSHPHVVTLHDLDRQGESYYVVMEHVDGESLRNVADSLAPELLSEDEALGVVRAVGEALLYAHASGIVHGDVRAENVLVTGQQDVKLMFAPACLARSAPFDVEPRDDVYGLASLAYELLSGHAPPPMGPQSGGGRRHAPPRIRNLSRGTWNALRSALLGREQRTRTVRQFLTGLGVPERRMPRHARPAPGRPSGGRNLVRGAAIVAGVVVVAGVAVLGIAQLDFQRVGDLRQRASGQVRALGGALVDRAGQTFDQVMPDAADRAAAPTGGAAATDGAADDAQTSRASGAETAPTRGADTGQAVDAEAGPAVGTEADPAVGTEADPAVDAETSRQTVDAAGPTEAGSGAPGADAPAEVDAEPAAPPVVADRGNSPSALEDGARLPGVGAGSASAGQDEAVSSSAIDGPGARSAVAAGAAATSLGADGAVAGERAQRAEAAAPGAPAPVVESPAAAPREGSSAPAQPLAFGRTQVRVSESQSVVPLEIRRADGTGEMMIAWWTSDGTATAPDDYADLGRVFERLADGERSRTIYVPITSDSRIEETEQFVVNLSALTEQGNQRGALLTATVTIVDDDF